MRVAFLTNQTTRVNLPLLQRLRESRQATLVHIFFFDTVSAGRRSLRATLRQLGLRGCGKKVAQLVTSRLRVCLGQRLGSARLAARSAYELALIDRLPHSLEVNMNRAAVMDKLRELDVDLLLVCVCKNILGARLLATPGVRFINVHPSLLPDYRGPAPTFWTLYHGETLTGVSFHEMTPAIDQGPCWAQYSMPLDRQLAETEIEERLFQLAGEHIEELLTQLRAGVSPPQPVEGGGSYFTYPTPADRRELQRRLAAVEGTGDRR